LMCKPSAIILLLPYFRAYFENSCKIRDDVLLEKDLAKEKTFIWTDTRRKDVKVDWNWVAFSRSVSCMIILFRYYIIIRMVPSLSSFLQWRIFIRKNWWLRHALFVDLSSCL
jgi:hypothetical protein